MKDETEQTNSPQGSASCSNACYVGDLVVVSHWSDFDWPHDAVELGILTEIRDEYYYINGQSRGYKHCIFVHRKEA